jgi:hypothetical protein
MSEFYEYAKQIVVLFSIDFLRELIIGVSVSSIMGIIRWCQKKWKEDKEKKSAALEKDIVE